MRVFLSGSTGFIGTNLVKALSGHKLCLYKRGEDIVKTVKDFRPEIIYHLAAERKDEDKMWASNVDLTIKLVNACMAVPFMSFIYMGSSSEYGIQDKPMKETMVCDPKTFYGETKLLGSANCLNLAIFGRNVMMLRPFSVYGPGEAEDRFMPTVIRNCLGDRPIELWSGNHDWVYIDDVVNALLYFGNEPRPAEIINIGTGISTSNTDVVKLIEKLLTKEIKVNKHRGMRRETDSRVWVADTTKAKEFGWEAKVSLEKGLRRQIDDIRTKG